MPKNTDKRLAELERRLAATHERATESQREEIWAQFSDEERDAALASLERRQQPGYRLTAEDKTIERRWYEVVQAVVPEAEWVSLNWREWAVQWGKAVRAHS